jgi:hypothetical protein
MRGLKMSNIFTKTFAKTAKSGILYNIGCGNPKSQAAACHRQGGELPRHFFTASLIFESVGRAFLRGVTCDTFSTPAGSFFVPTVESRGKSNNKKTLSQGGAPCATHTKNALFIPSLSACEVSK